MVAKVDVPVTAKSPLDVAFVEIISVNVFTPAKDCDVVDTKPRAVNDAFGKLK